MAPQKLLNYYVMNLEISSWRPTNYELIGAPPPLLRPVALTAGCRQIQHGGVPGRSG